MSFKFDGPGVYITKGGYLVDIIKHGGYRASMETSYGTYKGSSPLHWFGETSLGWGYDVIYTATPVDKLDGDWYDQLTLVRKVADKLPDIPKGYKLKDGVWKAGFLSCGDYALPFDSPCPIKWNENFSSRSNYIYLELDKNYKHIEVIIDGPGIYLTNKDRLIEIKECVGVIGEGPVIYKPTQQTFNCPVPLGFYPDGKPDNGCVSEYIVSKINGLTTLPEIPDGFHLPDGLFTYRVLKEGEYGLFAYTLIGKYGKPTPWNETTYKDKFVVLKKDALKVPPKQTRFSYWVTEPLYNMYKGALASVRYLVITTVIGAIATGILFPKQTGKLFTSLVPKVSIERPDIMK